MRILTPHSFYLGLNLAQKFSIWARIKVCIYPPFFLEVSFQTILFFEGLI